MNLAVDYTKLSVEELRSLLAERDSPIKHNENMLANKYRTLAQKDQALAHQERVIENKDRLIKAIEETLRLHKLRRGSGPVLKSPLPTIPGIEWPGSLPITPTQTALHESGGTVLLWRKGDISELG